ncbi:MAG: hypothetical protein ABW036_05635, partial [Flavitalea sp.]
EFGENKTERSKRIAFYESKGAIVIPGIKYAQPAMAEGKIATEMKLMILPADPMPSKEEIRSLIIQLYKELYGKAEKDDLLQDLLSQFNS